jgi:hypothetical protein
MLKDTLQKLHNPITENIESKLDQKRALIDYLQSLPRHQRRAYARVNNIQAKIIGSNKPIVKKII